jgi:hypothetical protein
MGKFSWAIVFSGLVVVGAFIGVWMLAPLVPGSDIKASCHEPLTQDCMDRIRGLGDQLFAEGKVDDAASWYGWAAGGGDKIAMFRLGGISYVRAVEDAARSSHPDLVGSEEGRRAAVKELGGFPAATACAWFRHSADLGYPPAMNNVGECYLYGTDFTRSGLAAVQWHRSAADAGNPVAAMNLIRDVKHGLGSPADKAAAEAWGTRSLDPIAHPDLDEITLAYTLRSGVPITPEEREAMRTAGATIASVEAAAPTGGSDAGIGDCGLMAECALLQGQAAAVAAPAAGAPSPTPQ